MARAKKATGKCAIKKRKYTCAIRLSKGAWTVTTTARGAAGVVAQSSRRVVVR
jgi:nitrogen fixation protein FixH